MVGYQQDSIVSRVIVDKKTGTITLFAFDVKQSLSEHTAPFDAMVYLVEGEAEITIDKGKFVLREGDMIVMPANIPHAVKATKRFKMLLVMIKS
ncbi:cupin domain-containing protein [candidate division KSB1 bacterium]|nr:MAG: cupin domain-containing protein [candidate division KSB1 bacterium]